MASWVRIVFFIDPMMKQLIRRSTQLSCFVELSTGTALVLFPAFVIQLLLGKSLPDGGHQLAQLYGAALIGFGIACWSSVQVPLAGSSRLRLGLMLYNFGAAFLLAGFSVNGTAQGLMVWPAVLIHFGLGGLMLINRQRKRLF